MPEVRAETWLPTELYPMKVDPDDINGNDVIAYINQGDGQRITLPIGTYKKDSGIYTESGEAKELKVKQDNQDGFVKCENANNGTIRINISSKKFSSSEFVQFLIATEEGGCWKDSVKTSYTIYKDGAAIGYNQIEIAKEGDEETKVITKNKYDSDEKAKIYLQRNNEKYAPACIANFFLMLEEGKYTVELYMTSKDFDFKVLFTFEVDEKAVSTGGLIDKEYYKEEAEDVLKSHGLMVVIDTGGDFFQQTREEIKGEYEWDLDLPFNIDTESVFEIFVFYELTVWDEIQTASFNFNGATPQYIDEMYSDYCIQNEGYSKTDNADCYAIKQLKINRETGNIEIPLLFTVNYIDAWGSGHSTEIYLTITTEATEDGTEERPPAPFVDVLTNITDYIPNSGSSSDEVENKVSIILTIITNIGIIVAVLMSAIVGIKYMLGSVEEKADYKKDMIPYLIGACLLLGVCTFVKILQAIGNNINNI